MRRLATLALLGLSACDEPSPGKPGDTASGADSGCSATTWFVDADDDGFGGGTTVEACDAPEGTVAEGGDCDDADPAVHPAAVEVWYDGVDSDCDDADDYDQDGDGHAAAAFGGDDCDDLDARLYPFATLAVPDDVATVQAAIDLACEAMTVFVGAGEWVEDLTIDKLVGVEGAGADATTIRGTGTTSVVTMSAGALGSLTVTGGAAELGGGVRIEGAALATLTDVVVEGNVATEAGGGVYARDVALLMVFDSVVRGNEADERGGGIAVEEPRAGNVFATWLATTEVSGNVVAFDGSGAGLWLSDETEAAPFQLEDVDVVANGGWGAVVAGGAYVAGTWAWEGGSLVGNWAIHAAGSPTAYAGGLYAEGVGRIEGVTLEGNAGGRMGAAYLEGETYASDLVVRGNSGEVGGIWGYGTLQVADARVDANRGSGIYGGGDLVTVLDTVLVGNAGAPLDLRDAWEVARVVALDNADRVELAGAGTVRNLVVAGTTGGGGLYWASADAADRLDLAFSTFAGNAGDGLTVYTATGIAQVAHVVSTGNAGFGVDAHGRNTGLDWMDVWGNAEGDWASLDPSAQDGFLTADPRYRRSTGDAALWDLCPGDGSPLVDAGEPSTRDADGSVADLGFSGGPDADPDACGDADGDGLSDGWEDRAGLDPNAGDDGGDADGDGLANAEEAAAGTDPGLRDSDGDRVADGDEVAAGTDPLLAEVDAAAAFGPNAGDVVGGFEDVDGDGLPELLISSDDGLLVVPGTARGELDPGAVALAVVSTAWAGTSPGDVDGDGHADVVAGSIHAGPGAYDEVRGGAALLLGPFDARSGETDGTEPATTVLGQRTGDRVGTWVGGLGDLDGDGRIEVGVGAPGVDDGGNDAGVLLVVDGDDAGDVDLAWATRKLVGEAGEAVGSGAAALGDVDGDGLGDVAVLAAIGGAGGAYVVLGPVDGEVRLATDAVAVLLGGLPTFVPEEVAGPGDVDGDGLADVALGLPQAYGDAGAVVTMRGPFVGDLGWSSIAGLARGEQPWDFAGSTLAAVGDADGDGVPDLLAGAASADGGVWLLSGDLAGTATGVIDFGRSPPDARPVVRRRGELA